MLTLSLECPRVFKVVFALLCKLSKIGRVLWLQRESASEMHIERDPEERTCQFLFGVNRTNVKDDKAVLK